LGNLVFGLNLPQLLRDNRICANFEPSTLLAVTSGLCLCARI
jgi:hypothetical protein